MDYNGNFILPVEYSDLSRGSYDESDNILRARKREEDFYRYLRPDGTPLTDYTFTECEEFCRIGVGKRDINGREVYGAVNAQGETIIPFEYDYLSPPHPAYYNMEYLIAQKDGKYGAFHYDGSLLRRFIYPSDTAVILSLSLPAQMTEEEELNALIAASQTWEPYLYDGEAGNGLWGYRPTQYDTEYSPYGSIFWAVFASAQPFDETGHAQVTCEDGRVGTIDQSGNFTPAAAGKADTTFSDVPAGSWYESGIKLCAEKGIMIGMGDGTFAPDKTLTAAECLTLALRLYDLCHGGKGVIEKAPENWDQITITAADGTTVTGWPGQPFQYQGKGAKGLDTEGVWFAVQAGQEALAQELNGMAATVTIHGKDYPATLSYSTRSYIDGTSENILFAAYTGDNSSIHHAFAVTTNHYWWADSAAMVQKLGLYDWASEESNGFRDLYVAAASGLEATARRAHFADSLATAAGTLPVLQEKVTIPDLGIPEQGVAPVYENILMLYRAGVLNGKDASGSFDYSGQLTRAECATMVARVLDPTLRIGAGATPAQPSTDNMTTTEVEVEVNRNLEKPFTTYAAAVEKLRSGMGYSNERTFDTDTCTIFCYDLGGFMNAPLDYLRVVYKAGGAYPEGTILDLPFTTDRGWHVNTRTDSMTLSGDKKSFTYTYTFEEIGNYGNPVQAGGTYTYVFDIPSGKVTLTQPVLRTVTYAQALEQVTQEEGYTVEKIVEGAGATAVLRYSLLEERNSAKSYSICLVYRSGGLKKEGTVDIEQLPVTAVDGFYTDRAPDHMFFSKDGRSFFCTYYYTPHDGSPYTSILDLEQGYHSSGHLPTVVELLSAGATVDKRVDGPAATALLVYDEHDGAKDYILYLINKETGGAWPVLLPSTYVGAADDGSVYYPTDRAPDSISFSADGSILTYVYKFAQALKKDGTVYHEAGTYTYKVNVTTGELSVAHT